MAVPQTHFTSPWRGEVDRRRISDGGREGVNREAISALAHRAIGLAMAHPVSRNWKGYRQRAV